MVAFSIGLVIYAHQSPAKKAQLTQKPLTVTLTGRKIECRYAADLGENVLQVKNSAGTDSTGLILNSLAGCDALDEHSSYTITLQLTDRDHYDILTVKQLP